MNSNPALRQKVQHTNNQSDVQPFMSRRMQSFSFQISETLILWCLDNGYSGHLSYSVSLCLVAFLFCLIRSACVWLLSSSSLGRKVAMVQNKVQKNLVSKRETIPRQFSLVGKQVCILAVIQSSSLSCCSCLENGLLFSVK